jgi:hypothetical protein
MHCDFCACFCRLHNAHRREEPISRPHATQVTWRPNAISHTHTHRHTHTHTHTLKTRHEQYCVNQRALFLVHLCGCTKQERHSIIVHRHKHIHTRTHTTSHHTHTHMDNLTARSFSSSESAPSASASVESTIVAAVEAPASLTVDVANKVIRIVSWIAVLCFAMPRCVESRFLGIRSCQQNHPHCKLDCIAVVLCYAVWRARNSRFLAIRSCPKKSSAL